MSGAAVSKGVTADASTPCNESAPMRLLSLFLLAPLTFTACSFSYVERDNNDDWNDGDWGDWGNDDDTPDDTGTDEPSDPAYDYGDAFTFDPDYLVIGDMQVLVMYADAEVCADVVALDIGADVEVHTVQALETEIRIALTVDANEQPGTSDITIQLDDGTRVVLADVLDVLTPDEAAHLDCDEG